LSATYNEIISSKVLFWIAMKIFLLTRTISN